MHVRVQTKESQRFKLTHYMKLGSGPCLPTGLAYCRLLGLSMRKYPEHFEYQPYGPYISRHANISHAFASEAPGLAKDTSTLALGAGLFMPLCSESDILHDVWQVKGRADHSLRQLPLLYQPHHIPT